MRKFPEILILTALIAMCSCNPKISTSLTKNYPPLDYKQEVVVIGLDGQVPNNSEELGEVKIGDSGFSTNCGYEIVIEKAKLEARKIGGNAIKITEHRPPTVMNPCHRISARILRIENLENLVLQETKEDLLDIDYAILNVYRFSGPGAFVSYDLYLGDSVICRVKNNFKTTIKITKDGLNSLWAKTEAKAEVPIDVKFGKEYYLRCSTLMGAFVGRPKLELLNKKTGKSEFDNFKPKNQ